MISLYHLPDVTKRKIRDQTIFWRQYKFISENWKAKAIKALIYPPISRIKNANRQDRDCQQAISSIKHTSAGEERWIQNDEQHQRHLDKSFSDLVVLYFCTDEGAKIKELNCNGERTYDDWRENRMNK